MHLQLCVAGHQFMPDRRQRNCQKTSIQHNYADLCLQQVENMLKPSLFRSFLLTTSLATLGALAVILLTLWFGVIQPLEKLAYQEAAAQARKEVLFRLDAKKEAVISIAASLARDPRVIQGALDRNHSLAFSALDQLQQNFAERTDYKSVFAQVILADRRILARSWDPEFSGGLAPHPLVENTLLNGQALASFSLGNAGPGILGFAPILHQGEVIGVISVTQGVGSVVRSLANQHIDWLLLLDESSIRARFSGHIPATYVTNERFHENYLLAHNDWFDVQLAQTVRAQWSQLINMSSDFSFHRLNQHILFNFPAIDSTGAYIGRSLVITDASSLDARIAEGRSSLILTVASVLTVVILVVFLLFLLMRQRVLQPVKQLVTSINEAVESGQFSRRFESNQQDELGELSHSLNHLFTKLELIIQEASQAISELAEGDLHRRISQPFQGDMEIFKKGFNTAAEQLQQTQTALKEASQAKSQFLANMSHEIRTPINGVLGMLTLLDQSELAPRQREEVGLARRSAELLLQLVNDLLDFSKIEAGKMETEALPTALQDLLKQLEAQFSHLGRRTGVRFQVDQDPELPAWILTDALRLQQVLNNLLSNAFKFTQRGVVTLSVHPQGEVLRFTIQDTGIGIAPEAAERLFDSFMQADNSTSRQYGGTGLGLVISKQLVELMGGTMDFSSQLGVGSQFWFTLPFKPCAPPKRIDTATIALPQWSWARVLLVEDNLVNQKLASRLLEKFGIQPDLAINGEEALQQASQQTYDLILMDCQMPIMDGYTATQELRKKGYTAPIVALTANASTDDRQTCLDAGMNDFLAKPYTMDSLIALLRVWLDTKP